MSIDSSPFQHLVIMRFSYPALGGFKMARSGIEDSVKKLYEPNRIERRFHIFEKLTLPSLLGQSVQSHQTMIIVGNDMPKKYLDHLFFLLRPLPNARIISLPPMRGEVAHVLGLNRDSSKEFIATTRLDDDDAMSLDLVERIQKKCRIILRSRLVSLPVAIAFNNGFFLEKRNDGAFVYGVREWMPIGIGLTLLANSKDKQTVYTRDHRQATSYWNCVSDSSTPSFIRSVHQDNDSNAKSHGVSIEYSEAQMKRILKNRFGFSLDELQSI
jgi:hypothetical protein